MMRLQRAETGAAYRQSGPARERFLKSSTVHAVDTGRIYGGLPVWQVVPAPATAAR